MADAPNRRPRANRPKAKVFAKQHLGPAATKEGSRRAAKREEIALRRVKAWRLFVDQHLTFKQIGDKLGVSDYTAWHDCVNYIEGVERQGLLDEHMNRAQILENLRSVSKAHWARRDREGSAKVILQALTQQERLTGAAVRRQEGFSAEQVVGVIRSMVDMFTDVVKDPALRQAFILRLKAKVPAELMAAPSTGHGAADLEAMAAPVDEGKE